MIKNGHLSKGSYIKPVSVTRDYEAEGCFLSVSTEILSPTQIDEYDLSDETVLEL